jgi:hypothetical protein
MQWQVGEMDMANHPRSSLFKSRALSPHSFRSSTKASFLRRHNRAVALLGALLAFATYIAKERLQEHWKQLAEVLEKTKQSYERDDQAKKEENALHEIAAQVDSLRGDVLYIKLYGSGRTKQSQATDAESFNVHSIILGNFEKESDLESFKLKTDHLLLLSKALPENEPRYEELKHLSIDIDAAIAHLNDLEAGPKNEVVIVDNAHNMARARKASEALDKVYTPLFNRVNGLSAELLTEAEEQRTRDERYAFISGYVSAGLYFVGWLLGLAGKISGVSEVGSEE